MDTVSIGAGPAEMNRIKPKILKKPERKKVEKAEVERRNVGEGAETQPLVDFNEHLKRKKHNTTKIQQKIATSKEVEKRCAATSF